MLNLKVNIIVLELIQLVDVHKFKFFKDDWRADGVRWKNYGRKENKSKSVEKRYYNLEVPTGAVAGFRRQVYNLKGNETLKLVHYIGDDGLIVEFPHRNCKTKTGTYSMTLPSTLLAINEACTSKDAHMVYKDAVNSSSKIFLPKPLCKNIQIKMILFFR